MAPDVSSQTVFLEKMFRFRLNYSLNKAEVYKAMDDGKIVGIATWIPPNTERTKDGIVNNGGIEAFSQIMPEIRERWFGFMNWLSLLMKYVQQPYWSLSPIAVLPERHGEGIASMLIRQHLAKIDKQNLPYALATQDKINVGIYKRYGFKVIGEDEILNSSIINYTMVRPAIGLS